jgi:hypothetical protein
MKEKSFPDMQKLGNLSPLDLPQKKFFKEILQLQKKEQ